MLAVDTNVIVRYLTRDDPEQFARASALIRSEDVFICTTVLLECEWVLRGAYRYSRDRIADALHLAGTEHCAAFVSFDRSLIRRAWQHARMPVRPA